SLSRALEVSEAESHSKAIFTANRIERLRSNVRERRPAIKHVVDAQEHARCSEGLRLQVVAHGQVCVERRADRIDVHAERVGKTLRERVVDGAPLEPATLDGGTDPIALVT